MSTAAPTDVPVRSLNAARIFWGSFIALVTCAFGFAIRTQVIGDWAKEFNLTETQKGEILSVGFWPFAFSIFLFSLFIDRVGYGVAAFVGFLFHLSSTLLLVFAVNYQMLFWGTFLFALSNGTVESYINVTAATMYPREKTKWLNIMHAGWPAGMAVAALLAISMEELQWHWQWKVALAFLPTAAYGALLVGARFPVSERVAAGVTYREMLADFGALGAFIAVYMISLQACDVVKIESYKFIWALLPAVTVAGAFGAYVRSMGHPLYFFLMLIMIPLATTELGIDSWITELMEPEMTPLGLPAGLVYVYTALIMMVLRFCAGPLVHRLSPLGLLTACAALAIAGLLFLSQSFGVLIFVAATLYGVGKSFFWPTMLGVAAERFPRGGAMTLNCIGGVGMLGLSIGGVFLGNIQDRATDARLAKDHPTLHAAYATQEKTSLLGAYRGIDQEKFKTAPDADSKTIQKVQAGAKKGALMTAAIFPALMLICYIALLLYFRAQGGYKAQVLESQNGGAST